MTFEDILASTLGVEGGYSNHKNDPGGATAYGVTEAVARQYGYTGPMSKLPLSVARDIYYKLYWVAPHFDQIGAISMPIAAELFDTFVNMGSGNIQTLDGPKFWLQRWLNALNGEGTLYADLTVDGDLGPATRAALSSYIKVRGKQGEAALVKALNHMQGARYLTLTEARVKNEDFTYGWLTNRT